MGKFRIYDKRKNFARLLFTVFLAYLCSNSLFTHIHLTEDAVISHSHFYAGTPDNPEHSHSQAQFSLIAALSHFSAVEVGCLCALFTPLLLCSLLACGAARLTQNEQSHRSLRAPPAVR